jgi:YD repeat-containing protein
MKIANKSKLFAEPFKIKLEAEDYYKEKQYIRPVNIYRSGNTVTVYYADGSYTTYSFRRDGQINSIQTSSMETIVFKYDYRDRLAGVKFDNGFETEFEYDYRDRLVKESSKGYYRIFEYDYRDNLVQYKDSSGHWHKYEYNFKNQITYESESNGLCKTYTYNYCGELTDVVCKHFI